MKRVLVTGVTGQDGPYLAEVPLEKVYEDHGIKRRASLFNTQRVDHIYEDPPTDNSRCKLHYGDPTGSLNLTRILREVEPDEVYNLGAQSHVAVSFEAPEYAADVDAIGTLRLLEAIRFLGLEVGDVIMRIDPRYSRPAKVETLLGDPTNAKEESGWVSEITAQEMCAEIVFADLEAAKRLKLLKAHRLDVPVSVEG